MQVLPSCPLCGSRAVGRVGIEQYYCWDCFMEFDGQGQVYEVAEDGSLMAYQG